MKILSEIDVKNLDQNYLDLAIGITDNKDDARKFKFKRPLMLKIFVLLCILTLSTIVVSLLAISYKFKTLFNNNSCSQEEHIKNLLTLKENIREKRQLDNCKDCQHDLSYDELDDSILRCKKNIENHMDCCELYKKIKEFNKIVIEAYKDIDLSQIPCKLKESDDSNNNINNISTINTESYKEVIDDQKMYEIQTYMNNNSDSINDKIDNTPITENNNNNYDVNIKVDIQDQEMEDIDNTQMSTLNQNPTTQSIHHGTENKNSPKQFEETTRYPMKTNQDYEYSNQQNHDTPDTTNKQKIDQNDAPYNNINLDDNLVHTTFTTIKYYNTYQTNQNQVYDNILPQERTHIQKILPKKGNNYYETTEFNKYIEPDNYRSQKPDYYINFYKQDNTDKPNTHDQLINSYYQSSTLSTQYNEEPDAETPNYYSANNYEASQEVHKIVNKHLNDYYTGSSEKDIDNKESYENIKPATTEEDSETTSTKTQKTILNYNYYKTDSTEESKPQETLNNEYEMNSNEKLQEKTTNPNLDSEYHKNTENPQNNYEYETTPQNEELLDQLKRMQAHIIEYPNKDEQNNNNPYYIYQDTEQPKIYKQLGSDQLIEEKPKIDNNQNEEDYMNKQTDKIYYKHDENNKQYTTSEVGLSSEDNNTNPPIYVSIYGGNDHKIDEALKTTETSLYDYERYLKKDSYDKNQNEMKPEQLFKLTTIEINGSHRPNNYDQIGTDNDNSLDDYTDSRGKTEDLENSQENRDLASPATVNEEKSQPIDTTTDNYHWAQEQDHEELDNYKAPSSNAKDFDEKEEESNEQTIAVHGEITYDTSESKQEYRTQKTTTIYYSTTTQDPNTLNYNNIGQENKPNEEIVGHNLKVPLHEEKIEPTSSTQKSFNARGIIEDFKEDKQDNKDEAILKSPDIDNNHEDDVLGQTLSPNESSKHVNLGFTASQIDTTDHTITETFQDKIQPRSQDMDDSRFENDAINLTSVPKNTENIIELVKLDEDDTTDHTVAKSLQETTQKDSPEQVDSAHFHSTDGENTTDHTPTKSLQDLNDTPVEDDVVSQPSSPTQNDSLEQVKLELPPEYSAHIHSITDQDITDHLLRKSPDDTLIKLELPTADPAYFQIDTTDHTVSKSFQDKTQPRIQGLDDIRIVNQNPVAQRFQNMGPGANSKFDNIFQLPPVETSKASQQLTVNTNMLPMCFYGVPSQNGAGLRQPGYDSGINPFSTGSYGAFGYPQMYLNNLNQQPMYNYYNSMMAQQKYQPSFMNNPYFCTYVSSSSLQFPPISGTQEFRNIDSKNFAVPDDIDDKTIPEDLFPHLINQNKSRSSSHCLPKQKSCFDGIQCIKNYQWCDSIIHCNDKSDELGCPCKTRLNKSKLCDGYFDCPNGEDELGCFGCDKEEFSCDDWGERQKTASCVPLTERCDGIAQCRTGKDEMDCSLLTNTINVHQTYAVSKSSGYLHRNFKGNWYPVCSNTDSWVLDACLAEVGPQATLPLVHMLPVPNNYVGEFLTALPDKKVEFLKSCLGGEAIYVICPPIPCGTRLLPPPNHFRKQEVDTSGEENFLPFVSRLRRFTHEFHKHGHLPNILSSNDIVDKKHHITLDTHVDKLIDVHNNYDLSLEEQERKKRGETRVVGGKPSQPTSWPWVVAIYRDGIFHCGGVLMSELWIITAAHCVDTYWQHYYEVQAGMLRRFSFSPMEQNRVVAGIIGHQLYDRTDMKNDLALLKVARPFQFNRWVRPVCLPSESSAGPNWMWGPQPGTICTAVGWGATIEHGPDPDHMREVEVPILSHCKHREDQEGQEICAGYLEGGRDACQGDSGGPLLCRNPVAPSQWYVAGIVSHGEGCARPNEPGAYTRVSLYLNWIARSILDENLPKRKPIQQCPGTLCLGTRRCISKKRRCDKSIDCLVGDDEINCPKSDYSALIKHAFDNMLLFSSHNATTAQPETDRSVELIHGVEAEKDKKSNEATEIFTKDKRGKMKDINENTNQSLHASTDNILSNSSVTQNTFITDTISESGNSNDLTTVSAVTVTTSIHTTTETMVPGIINDSRGALNTNDKSIVDMDHKTETATPDEIKNITETLDEFNAGDEDSNLIKNNASKSIAHEIPSYFECRKILQLIPMSRRCDNIIDCEDGTDEQRCTCKGYLYSSHPGAICDGIIDCADGSDETNCINCPDTHFHCHLSQQCVPKSLQCNHEPDCFFNEDEWDCFALTNGSYIRYDSDERPELRGKGVMSFSFSGKWFPLCNNDWYQTAHDVAGDMCAYLGFSGYHKFFEAEVKQENMEILSRNSTSLSHYSSTNETCRGLYVKCSNSLSDTGDMKKIYTAHQSGANTFKEVLMSPWNAAIFVDGVYTCSGTLIEKNWVITSRTCLHNIQLQQNYTSVMLGSGRGHFNVVGPHEQIRLVTELVPVMVTDILLIRLQKPVTFTRYVRPLYIRNINNDIVSEKETCIALGKENDSFMQIIVLKPVMEKCMRGKRCFKRVTPIGRCNVGTSEWGGSITCLSESGWYPAAVYYDQKGICGFRTTTEYTSIRNLKARIITAMNKHDFPATPPNCDGIRCPLGKCVKPNNICDGISDCRDGSDEIEDLCYQKEHHCAITKTCECAPGELRCQNGRCVSKSAFCDRINDCGDWSDEPARCNCSTYLALVAPRRLCDGISNCHDKSDENPRTCPCRQDSFKCSGITELCIPNDWVCDGDFDCPEKEDEMFCLGLRPREQERDGVGEVVLRSYGIWHSYCIRDKPLTIPDLEEICADVGHKTSHAAKLNKNYTRLAQDIAIENFSLVRFNEHVMMFLKGDYPTAKLQTNDKCERLYIECTPP